MTSYECVTTIQVRDEYTRNRLYELVARASTDGGRSNMKEFCQRHASEIIPHEPDVDCHHVSLVADVLLNGKDAPDVYEEAYRTFLSGCSSEGDVVRIYTYGAWPDDFFKTLADACDGVTFVNTEDDSEDEWDDDEYENDDEYEDDAEYEDGDGYDEDEW